MIPIPASILAIENESDRDFMENIFFSYQRLIYHEIGSILNDPWSKDDIFQTVIVQLINNIDTLRPMPAKVLTSYIATSARNAALTYIRNISRRKEILADEFDNSNQYILNVFVKPETACRCFWLYLFRHYRSNPSNPCRI